MLAKAVVDDRVPLMFVSGQTRNIDVDGLFHTSDPDSNNSRSYPAPPNRRRRLKMPAKVPLSRLCNIARDAKWKLSTIRVTQVRCQQALDIGPERPHAYLEHRERDGNGQ
ncbi:hypothetical protein D9611_005344 [Ephemerocybe angulata]|uniref:Uncharacterized protein n=1 Tax=Ephemerocybe angulata TaxID=980116 RepID=A0A8H5FDH6_9AGAR|nr:hypothetical protein D9611_005344 [Tulosesus angulatus]